MDHFEYPTPRHTYNIPQLEAIHGTANALTVKQMHPGFTPTLRVLDLCRCQIGADQLADMLATGYCGNLGTLRLTKMGSSQHWYDDVDWPVFGHFLKTYLPMLCDLQLSIWWDEPSEFFERARPEDLDELIGTLSSILGLDSLAIELGLLVHSFGEDATTELLALPSTALKKDLKRRTYRCQSEVSRSGRARVNRNGAPGCIRSTDGSALRMQYIQHRDMRKAFGRDFESSRIG